MIKIAALIIKFFTLYTVCTSSVIKVLMKLYGKCGVEITRTYELGMYMYDVYLGLTSRLTALEKGGPGNHVNPIYFNL